MDSNNRVFEETHLTKTVSSAIAIALEYMKECGLKQELILLYDKIKEEKLDVRFIPREE